MSKFKEEPFGTRLKSAADAKQAMLARFQTRSTGDDAALASRRAERQAIVEARNIRLAEREAARRAEAARVETEQARVREQEAADQARDAAEASARALALQAEQKAARDARYAARKARKRG
ncbi:DUF6481 family protein [Methylobacterium nodulans]|uniref:Uncharacterized protein n=1 Tax=Methylobacterium nodulans (strain LMG 21967 / CNCM I-2342 / ORS 2060) TaxID=460265 RepID=B8IGH1_METNO|nr:DUF6481 family protein [Methylobacterium nodulans]ACL55871.1 conserved hypothetical protein [Methylobacterium nodulans ORS 2060]